MFDQVIEELVDWKTSMENDGMEDDSFYTELCGAIEVLSNVD